MDDLPLDRFLATIAAAGFGASDIHIPSLRESPGETAALHARYGMALVAMVTSEGTTPAEHCASLANRFSAAARCAPVRINCHTGRDTFSRDENLAILREAGALGRRFGVPVSHETHRGRATYSVPATRELLLAMPEMRLTADFSHWCCVHESLLGDQAEALTLAIERSDYIHARVGFIEGPQVSDPRAPEWSAEMEAHMGWWRRIASARAAEGTEEILVCPEFGPAPYMPLLPYSRTPVANLWDITLFMKDILTKNLG